MHSDNKDIASPLVTVIIPCYNLGTYLMDAIDSVRAQSYQNYEIIVVDDGSTDSETIALTKKLKRDDSLTVIIKKNEGLSEARNTGIAAAHGEYIVCLDADDKLSETYLEKTMRVMLEDTSKDLGFVTTWLQEFGAREDIWKTRDFNATQILIENCVHAGSLFKKSAWKKVGGYKKDMKGGYEDWEFWINLVEHGYFWRLVDQPLFLYRIRSDSMLSTMNPELHQELYEKIYTFHKGLFTKNLHPYVMDTSKKIKELHLETKKLYIQTTGHNEHIKAYETEIEQLTESLNEVSSELDQIHLSRVMRPALKTREVLMRARSGVHYARHHGAVAVKKATPVPVKNIFRKAKSQLRKKKLITVDAVKYLPKKPLVSIVTPFYNQGSTILETVNSVLNQTFINFEYIIVNDGSSSSQAKVLQTIKDDRVSIINLDENIGNGSPAAARNMGIQGAKGKYVVCLDSDDILDPTFIEKSLILLETNPEVKIASTDVNMFGHDNKRVGYVDYSATDLIDDNRLITASMFTREAWEITNGYKSGIGYEDWEFWINQAEHGYFGKLINEPLFSYRTALHSRYVEDKKKHRNNIKTIKQLHPHYKETVRHLQHSRRKFKNVINPETAFVNLDSKDSYKKLSSKKRILFALPWMTFGGAETLIVNFCNEIKDTYDLSFVTGLESRHEWEYKFKEMSDNIYHLPTLFNDKRLYVRFISNFIKTRKIDVLHTIHTSFMFDMIPELKKEHPNLKIVVTMFNDRVSHYFQPSIQLNEYVSAYVTDNEATANHYTKLLPDTATVVRIPNGIDCFNDYNPALFDRHNERKLLGLKDDDLAVFFIGRLSEEKNPDVFLDVAKSVVVDKKISKVKFFVVGDGVMRSELEKTIRSIGSENVTYLGYDPAVAHLLSAADIFVLPSAVEGFPLSILEAMAMSVAVIASDVGAVSDVIETGVDGIVVKPGSKTEITEAIVTLRGDIEHLQQIKRAARKKLETTYSNKVLGDNYKKMYKDLWK